MIHVRHLAAVLILMIQASGAAQPAARRALDPEERRRCLDSFDYVWKAVRDRYWDPRLGGLDWAALRDRLRPKVDRAASVDEARAVMRDLVSRLHASHFALVPADAYRAIQDPSESKPPGPGEGAIGLDFRVVDGQALVISVVAGSPAANAGVKPGWEIVQIGDTPLRAILDRLAGSLRENPRLPALLYSAVGSRLRGRVGDPVSLRFRDGRGRLVTMRLRIAEPRGHLVTFGNLPPVRVWWEARRLDGDVGYFAFNAFLAAPRVMKAFNEAMRSFADADGVIIDVRGNGGGMGEMALGMMGWFLREKRRRIGTVGGRDIALPLIVHRRAQTYEGPLVVLVDGLSGSAAELLASGLQDLGRACIVGSRTGGAVLGARMDKLPNGDGFMYPVWNYVSATRGRAVEGVGVVPDIGAVPTREALLLGRDPALESALVWLGKSRRTARRTCCY